MSLALHATLFDASALAKVFLDEKGSDDLRKYWDIQRTRYTTPFCLYETLRILKSRMLKHEITKQRYFEATTKLVVWYNASARKIIDPIFTQQNVFADAKKIAEQYDLDLSDAFLLLSQQKGFFSPLAGDSATLLVTADEALANTARTMGLRVWDCMHQPMPTS